MNALWLIAIVSEPDAWTMLMKSISPLIEKQEARLTVCAAGAVRHPFTDADGVCVRCERRSTRRAEVETEVVAEVAADVELRP